MTEGRDKMSRRDFAGAVAAYTRIIEKWQKNDGRRRDSSSCLLLLPIVSGPGGQGQAETCTGRRLREVMSVWHVSARARRIDSPGRPGASIDLDPLQLIRGRRPAREVDTHDPWRGKSQGRFERRFERGQAVVCGDSNGVRPLFVDFWGG